VVGFGAIGPSPLDRKSATRCSRAIRLAAVSLAKRGVLSVLVGLLGVWGCGVAIRSGKGIRALLVWCRKLLLLGTFRGVFSNCFSFVAEVGRSSKPSSSLPTPKTFLGPKGCEIFWGTLGCRARAAEGCSLRIPARLGVSGCPLPDRREYERMDGEGGLRESDFCRI
jgi:hypothetical protein